MQTARPPDLQLKLAIRRANDAAERVLEVYREISVAPSDAPPHDLLEAFETSLPWVRMGLVASPAFALLILATLALRAQ
jgi:hypothetical protein